MYDLAQPAEKPGRCPKCQGSGRYQWGGTVNGKAVKSGPCFSCRGKGAQDPAQIARNVTYNRHKIAWIASLA